MNAIEALNLVFDWQLDINQGGIFKGWDDADFDYPNTYFGVKSYEKGGCLSTKTQYLYYYECDDDATRLAEAIKPDVIIRDFQDCRIFLWEITA